MGDKIEKDFSRDEFAGYLETLARQMRAGNMVSAGGRSWTVPDTFSGKIHLKEKKGRIELKIQCRWSTLADYDVQDREQLAAWHESMEAVKKRMGTSFKEISRSAAEGRFPETAAVDEFVLTSKIFAGAADPEWKDVMDEYMDHLENFVLAVKRRERELMLHEIRDLQNRMKACHREFK